MRPPENSGFCASSEAFFKKKVLGEVPLKFILLIIWDLLKFRGKFETLLDFNGKIWDFYGFL